MKDVKVFSLTSNVELVNEICGYLNCEPGKVSIKHFADGETLVEFGESVRGKQVYLIQSTCKPVNERLMELLIAIDAAKRSSATDIVCIIPYFGYARQDRKAQPRQPITARLVADLLHTAGANRVVAIDLHAPQIQGFFSFPVDDLSSVPMMGHYFLHKGLDLENTVVVSPDHGGTTRARNLANILGTPIAIVDKRRPRPNVCEAKNVIGDVNGKDVIVIDDICDTGGSLIASCQILKDFGAKNVYVCLAHGVFSGEAIEKIENSVIHELVCTNSIPLSEEAKARTTKIKQLSIGKMLSKLIAAISTHTPVSEIYGLFTGEEDNCKCA
ncbi:MAG: ribose-phosphate pyrophosphokinase [Erysipelotrichaceae bacterium]|nr:ribose-phosphate pyrophosphokinase [Erysipelotrichaceae bacterium]